MGLRNRIVGIGLGLLVFGSYTVVSTPADARTKTIKGTATGTAVSANFDFENANESTPAFYVHGEGKSQGGRFSYQALVEVAPDGKPCTVSGAAPNAGSEFTPGSEFTLVSPDARVAVFRYASTGDLLFVKSTKTILCGDFSSSTPPYSFRTDSVITGGTGRFAKATGTVTSTGNGEFLSFDASGKRQFVWFQEDILTNLTLP
jgi:hypothetical protein